MKKLILTSLFAFGLTLFSCFREKCPPAIPYFEIINISAYNVKYSENEFESWSEVEEGEIVFWQNYFTRIWFDVDLIAQKQSNTFSGFSNSLLALDCVPDGFEGNKVGLKDITFITLNDYDSLHLKDDTINSIIKCSYWSGNLGDSNSFMEVEDFISLNNPNVKEQHFEFKVMVPPINLTQNVQFQVVYELNNGQFFNCVTDEIILSSEK